MLTHSRAQPYHYQQHTPTPSITADICQSWANLLLSRQLPTRLWNFRMLLSRPTVYLLTLVFGHFTQTFGGNFMVLHTFWLILQATNSWPQERHCCQCTIVLSASSISRLLVSPNNYVDLSQGDRVAITHHGLAGGWLTLHSCDAAAP